MCTIFVNTSEKSVFSAVWNLSFYFFKKWSNKGEFIIRLKIEIGWLSKTQFQVCSQWTENTWVFFSILYKISTNELQVFEKYTIKKIQYIYWNQDHQKRQLNWEFTSFSFATTCVYILKVLHSLTHTELKNIIFSSTTGRSQLIWGGGVCINLEGQVPVDPTTPTGFLCER